MGDSGGVGRPRDGRRDDRSGSGHRRNESWRDDDGNRKRRYEDDRRYDDRRYSDQRYNDRRRDDRYGRDAYRGDRNRDGGYRRRDAWSRESPRSDGRFQNRDSLERELDLATHFEKKRVIKSASDDFRPVSVSLLFSCEPYTIPALMQAKERLNSVKSRLDHIDLGLWGTHTNFTSRTSFVVRALRESVDGEMITTAWAKMYELLSDYPLLPTKIDTIRTAHLCEAPGAFICATNHFIRTKMPQVSWDWFGVSLNPYHEANDAGAMLDDDAFIAQTYEHWEFGFDNTGNIMHQDNIRAYWARARALGEVHLVTGDGSVDSLHDPNEQESMTAPIHFAELVSALGILAKGGNMVLKMFTYFEHSSVDISFLAAMHFDEVHICKPATSKAGNSETYLVGTGFKGVSSEMLEALLAVVGPTCFDQCSALPSSAIPQQFTKIISDCAVAFEGFQRQTIETNLRLFDNMSFNERRQIIDEKHQMSKYWVNRFQVERLPQNGRIVPAHHLRGSWNRTGTFAGGSARIQDGGTQEDRRAFKRQRQADLDLAYIPSSQAGEPVSPWPPTSVDSTSQMSVAERIMVSQGYTGGGLGRLGQGVSEPIQVTKLNPHEGLGLRSRDSDDYSHFWTFSRPSHAWEPSIPLFGPAPKRFIHSKFIEDGLLQRIIAASRSFAQDFPTKDSRRAFCCRHFACVHSGTKELSYRATKLRGIDGQTNGALFSATQASLGASPGILDLDPYSDSCTVFALSRVNEVCANESTVPQWKALTCASSSQNDVVEIVNARTTDGQLCPESIVLFVKTYSGNSIDIVLGSLSGQHDASGKGRLLAELLVTVSVLRTGGRAVFRLSGLLTRFEAGVFYVCTLLFQHASLAKPISSCPRSTEVFLYCDGYRVVDGMRSMLEAALSKYHAAPKGTDIHELVPSSLIVRDERLITFLTRYTSVLYEAQLQALSTN